jgi:predicted lipase
MNNEVETKISEKTYASILKNLARRSHPSSNIAVLLKTEYPIIHNLVHKYFNYRFYNKEDHYNDVFLLWMDTYVSEEFVKRLKSYQRINHFPTSC